jgi:hypothetical protein
VVPATVPIWKFAPPVLTLGLGAVHWCPELPEPRQAEVKSKLSENKAD